MINKKRNGFSLRQFIIFFVMAVLFGVIFYSALLTAGTIETRVLWSDSLIYGMAFAFAGIMLLSMFVRLVIPGLRGLSYFVTYGIILFGVVGASILMSKNDSVKHQESDAYVMQKKKVDSFLKSAQANDSLASVMLAAGQKGNARYYKALADKNREDYKLASVKMEKAGASVGHADNALFAGVSSQLDIAELWPPVLMGILISTVLDHSALLTLAVLLLLLGLVTWARDENGKVGLYPTDLCEQIFPFVKLAGQVRELNEPEEKQVKGKKASAAERRAWIKGMIKNNVPVKPSDVVEEFGVSTATAYSDFRVINSDSNQFGFN